MCCRTCLKKAWVLRPKRRFHHSSAGVCEFTSISIPSVMPLKKKKKNNNNNIAHNLRILTPILTKLHQNTYNNDTGSNNNKNNNSNNNNTKHFLALIHLLVQSRTWTLRRQCLARRKSPILTAETTRPLRLCTSGCMSEKCLVLHLPRVICFLL